MRRLLLALGLSLGLSACAPEADTARYDTDGDFIVSTNFPSDLRVFGATPAIDFSAEVDSASLGKLIHVTGVPTQALPNGSAALSTDGNLYVRQSDAWVAVSVGGGGGGSSLAASDTSEVSVSNTTTETALATLSVPAASVVQGSLVEVNVAARVTGVTGGASCNVRIKVEGTTVLTLPFDGGMDSAPFNVGGVVKFVYGNNGLLATQLTGAAVTGSASSPSTGIAVTGDLSVEVTAQWSAADAANICTHDGTTVTVLTPPA